MSILQTSISAGILVIAIVIIRALALNRLPKTMFLALWGVALLRLLVPFSISSQFNFYSIMMGIFQQVVPDISSPEIENVLATGISVVGTVGTTSTIEPVSQGQIYSMPPLTIIWLIGTLAMLALFTVIYFRNHRELSFALPVRNNEFLDKWLSEHKMLRSIRIMQSDRIKTPVAVGLVKPRIVLPKSMSMEDKQLLQYVLQHEYYHIRRFDMLWKLFIVLALCIHWFNPMVWVMFVLVNRDLELTCDEMVIYHFGTKTKTAYAYSIIGMAEQRNKFAPLYNGFSKNAIEERIVSIMKMKNISAMGIIMALVLIVGTTTVFATSALASKSESEIVFTANQFDENQYSEYEPFGLTVDEQTGCLYYDGELVRCFDDQIPNDDFGVKAIGYYEETGTIDVRTVRENDNSTSVLIGLEVLSSEEFENRVITNPAESNSADNSNLFSEYEEYGLTYDSEKNVLFYNDKQVRLFLDIRNSSGNNADSEDFNATISNWDENGSIDVYAVRNYEDLEEDGYGKLTGLRIATSDEYNANSLWLESKSLNGTTETAN